MAVTTKKKSGGGQTTPAASTTKTKATTSAPSKASSPVVAPAAPTYTPTTPKPATAPAYVPATGSTMQPATKAAQQDMSRNPHETSAPAAPAPASLPVWNQYSPSVAGTRTKAGSIPEPDRTSRPTQAPVPVYGPTNALGSGGEGIPVWNQYTRGEPAPPFNMMTRGIDLPVWNQYMTHLPNAASRGTRSYNNPWTVEAREAWRQGEREAPPPTVRPRAAGRTGAIDITYQTAPAPVVDPEGGLIYPPGYDTNGDGYADYWPQYAGDGYTPWDDWGRGGRGGGGGWTDYGDSEFEPQDWFVGMQNWRF